MTAPSPTAANAPLDSDELSLGLLPELLGYHLRRAQVALFRHFAETVAAGGLTPGLMGMLQVIAANPGLSQTRLAEAMEVDRSTIVKVMKQLEARGLIERIGAVDDRRRNCLYPSAEGQHTLRRIEADIQRHEAAFAAGLSAEERRQLITLLRRLYEAPSR